MVLFVFLCVCASAHVSLLHAFLSFCSLFEVYALSFLSFCYELSRTMPCMLSCMHSQCTDTCTLAHIFLIHILACPHACVHTRTCKLAQTHTQTHTHTRSHTHKLAHTQHSYACSHTHIHTRTRVLTHTHTSAHACVHTHKHTTCLIVVSAQQQHASSSHIVLFGCFSRSFFFFSFCTKHE